jgi:hypothetical protein
MAQFMLISTVILLFFWPLMYGISLYFREGHEHAEKVDELRERLAFKAVSFYDRKVHEPRFLGMGRELVFTTLVHLYLVLIFFHFVNSLALDLDEAHTTLIAILTIIVKIIATPSWYLSEIRNLGIMLFPLIIVAQVAYSLLQAKLLVEAYRFVTVRLPDRQQ